METTNDDKVLKTKVCQERKITAQILDEYKQNTKNLLTRLVPRTLRNSVITLLHKAHPSINKISHAILVAKDEQRNPTKMLDGCIPCKMTGNNNKPQLRMTG